MAESNITEEPDNEARIPTALDSQGNEITVWEAKRFQKAYRCVECLQPLIVRHGLIRIPYFAHYPQESTFIYCSLRTTSGVKKLTEDLRISQVEKKERNHTLRLAIIPDFDSRSVSLVAVFKSPDWGEFPRGDGIAETLNTIKIHGDGLINRLHEYDFHPNNPNSFIPLNPDTSKFDISIESNPTIQSICGNWSENALQDGTIFAGDWSFAEKIEKNTRISEEDVIYQIVSDSAVENYNRTLSIGKRRLVYFSSDEFKSKSLQGGSLAMLPLNPFEVDVLLPPNADPRGHLPILGAPESEALLAIRPRQDLDPEFEIVSVPSISTDPVLIERNGPGIIRYQKISFPKLGSKRISIHLGRSHTVLHFFVKEEDFRTMDKFVERERVGIEVKYRSGTILKLYPWQNDEITIDKSQVPLFTIFKPSEVRVNLDIEAYDGEKMISHPQHVAEDIIGQMIEMLIREGTTLFVLTFKGYGTLRILCSPSSERINEDEIKKRIIEKDIDINKRVTWGTLRLVVGITPGTSHQSIKNVTSLKQIRKVIKSMRENFR